jgi:hypothetical protein
MTAQTVTRSIESESEPVDLYNFLANAGNIPQWAPVFADSIERVSDGRYRVSKAGQNFDMELFVHPSAGAVDYLRKMPNGKRGGAYIRVTPRPLGGSVITMTVPLAANANESDVAKELESELIELIKVARP